MAGGYWESCVLSNRCSVTGKHDLEEVPGGLAMEGIREPFTGCHRGAGRSQGDGCVQSRYRHLEEPTSCADGEYHQVHGVSKGGGRFVTGADLSNFSHSLSMQ